MTTITNTQMLDNLTTILKKMEITDDDDFKKTMNNDNWFLPYIEKDASQIYRLLQDGVMQIKKINKMYVKLSKSNIDDARS